jgi:hypothetical protein
MLVLIATMALAETLTCPDTMRLFFEENRTDAEILDLISRSSIPEAEADCFRDSGLPVPVLLAAGQRMRVAQQAPRRAPPERGTITERAWWGLFKVLLIVETGDRLFTGVLVDMSGEDITLNVDGEIVVVAKPEILSVERADGQPFLVATSEDLEAASEREAEDRYTLNIPDRRRRAGHGLLASSGALAVVGLTSLALSNAETRMSLDAAENEDYTTFNRHLASAQALSTFGWAALAHLPPALVGGILCLTIPGRPDK